MALLNRTKQNKKFVFWKNSYGDNSFEEQLILLVNPLGEQLTESGW
jgi:hypothetical protein